MFGRFGRELRVVVCVGTVVAMGALGAGCKRTPPQVPTPLPPPEVVEAAPAKPEVVAELVQNFSRIHFDTDSSAIDTESKRLLEANAAILSSHPDLRVEIQGHADERGTTDYNLALGQRRANTVVTYLVHQGVSANRLPVVTYGEERPATAGEGEVAWAQNRRAEFRVLTGGLSVVGTTTN